MARTDGGAGPRPLALNGMRLKAPLPYRSPVSARNLQAPASPFSSRNAVGFPKVVKDKMRMWQFDMSNQIAQQTS
jgi:hypothetical protein